MSTRPVVDPTLFADTQRLIEALRALGYRLMQTYPFDQKDCPGVAECRLYTDQHYVHCLVVYADGSSLLFLQAGTPQAGQRVVQSHISALRALHPERTAP